MEDYYRDRLKEAPNNAMILVVCLCLSALLIVGIQFYRIFQPDKIDIEVVE